MENGEFEKLELTSYPKPPELPISMKTSQILGRSKSDPIVGNELRGEPSGSDKPSGIPRGKSRGKPNGSGKPSSKDKSRGNPRNKISD